MSPDHKEAIIGLDVGVPDEAFSHTAAHKHAHVLQRLMGYMEVQLPPGVAQESEEGRVRTNLAEAVVCVAVDELVQPFGLDPRYSVQRRLDIMMRNTETVTLKRHVTTNPRFVRFVLRCVRSALQSFGGDWPLVRSAMTSKWPEVASLGEELTSRLERIGRATRKQRRLSFEYLQAKLDLKGKVTLYNPTTGGAARSPYAPVENTNQPRGIIPNTKPISASGWANPKGPRLR